VDEQLKELLYDPAVGQLVAAVLAVAMVLMLAARWVQRLIGGSGASVVSRVMGLILASVAVNNVLIGIKSSFSV